MSDIPTQSRITPEAVRSLREKIGLPLRSRNSYNTCSCYDSVRHCCLGIGDHNPLWYDKGYCRRSVLGENLASPWFLSSVGIGVVQIGFPGVHGFHGGSEWQRFRPICHGEEIQLRVWLDDVVRRQSMGGKSVVNYFSSVFFTPQEDGKHDQTNHARPSRRGGRRRDGLLPTRQGDGS
jgi:hypothetical protein